MIVMGYAYDNNNFFDMSIYKMQICQNICDNL